MIVHDGINDFVNHKAINTFGFTEEQFYSLPYEYQRALILGHIQMISDRKKERDNLKKRRALKQYLFEEKVKEKVLSLIKKK